MTREERLEKLSDRVHSVCIGQERVAGEIVELRRSLAPLSLLPKEVLSNSHAIQKNQEAIVRIETEQCHARKRAWKLVIGTITAVTGGIVAFCVQHFVN